MSFSVAKYHSGVHLGEKDLLPEDPHCPICSWGGQREPVLRLQSSPRIYLLRCAQCGGESASRLPTEETLLRYYHGYYENSECAITCDDPSRFARHVIRGASPFLNGDRVSILDFGGGGGELSEAIAARLLDNGSTSAVIDLVDYNSHLSKPKTHGVLVRTHQSLSEVGANRYDLVLASAVLEHIPRPLTTLISLLSTVKAGGVFYARTPNIASILRILESLGLGFIDFTFPAHIHDLGQAFWERVPRMVEAEVGSIRALSSRPSVVETSFSRAPFRTLIAYVMKSPWYLLRSRYRFVGGWEVIFQRFSDHRETACMGKRLKT